MTIDRGLRRWVLDASAVLVTAVVAAVLGAIAAAPVAAKIDVEDARPLPWASQSGLYFDLDAVSFPPDSAIGRTEFTARIPGGALRSPDSLVTGGNVRVQLRLKDARGRTVLEERRSFEVPPRERDSTGFSPGQVVRIDARLPSGWYELRCTVEDMNTKKRGLLYLGSDRHKDGKVEGIFHVPEWPSAGVLASELQTAWRITTGDSSSPLAREGVHVVPNPGRTFGLYAPTLRAYYEIARHAAGAAPLVVSAVVRDPKGTMLLTADSDSVQSAGRSWGQIAFDVSTLPAGLYDLEVRFGAGDPAVTRHSRFNVAWRPESWRGDPHALVDEVHFLLDDPDQEERFARLTLGEQEAFLDQYWTTRDPTPGTAINERRQTFRERVATADRRWSGGYVRGLLTDRGRVYVRYGEPDEIQQEMMPTHGLQVKDIARDVAQREGVESSARLQGRGIGSDLRAFEVWTYDRLLHPSDESAAGTGPRRPMRRVFVFVDEEGYGDFVLRYSNE